MTIRNLMQTGLIKTSNAALSLRHKLERKPKDELVHLMRSMDLDDETILDILDYIVARIEEQAEKEADNA